MSELADSTPLASLSPGGFQLTDEAIDTAHQMRKLLDADLDEYDMADRVREMNEDLNATGAIHGAWHVLNSRERAAWKQLLKLERPDGY